MNKSNKYAVAIGRLLTKFKRVKGSENFITLFPIHSLSRFHGKFYVNDNHIFYEDTRSRNGTTVYSESQLLQTPLPNVKPMNPEVSVMIADTVSSSGFQPCGRIRFASKLSLSSSVLFKIEARSYNGKLTSEDLETLATQDDLTSKKSTGNLFGSAKKIHANGFSDSDSDYENIFNRGEAENVIGDHDLSPKPWSGKASSSEQNTKKDLLNSPNPLKSQNGSATPHQQKQQKHEEKTSNGNLHTLSSFSNPSIKSPSSKEDKITNSPFADYKLRNSGSMHEELDITFTDENNSFVAVKNETQDANNQIKESTTTVLIVDEDDLDSDNNDNEVESPAKEEEEDLIITSSSRSTQIEAQDGTSATFTSVVTTAQTLSKASTISFADEEDNSEDEDQLNDSKDAAPESSVDDNDDDEKDNIEEVEASEENDKDSGVEERVEEEGSSSDTEEKEDDDKEKEHEETNEAEDIETVQIATFGVIDEPADINKIALPTLNASQKRKFEEDDDDEEEEEDKEESETSEKSSTKPESNEKTDDVAEAEIARPAKRPRFVQTAFKYGAAALAGGIAVFSGLVYSAKQS